jgi:acyl-CoA reductase-like NAD-dependent aldehyde dehydrogenase
METLFWGSFINAGQTCSCLKRLYVHKDDVAAVGAALAAFVKEIPVGNGMEEGVLIGPLSNKMQFDKVSAMVADARAKGAVALAGGEASAGPGYFYPLTVLTGCTANMDVVRDEQFGTVLPIIAYDAVDAAVEAANSLEVGLGASVWGNDTDAATQVAKRLQAGTRWVNRHAVLNPMVPMGGITQSGIGVEFSEEGLREYTTVQVLSIAK